MPVAYEMGRGTGRRKVIFIFFFWKKKRRRFIYSDFAVNLRGNTHQRSIRTTFRFFLLPPPYFIICFYYIRLLFPPLLSPFAPSYVYGQARELWLSRRISYIYIYIHTRHIYAIFPPEVGVGGIRTEITAGLSRRRSEFALVPLFMTVTSGRRFAAGLTRFLFIFSAKLEHGRSFYAPSAPRGRRPGSERRISRPFCKQHTSRVLPKFPTSWPRNRPGRLVVGKKS